MMVFFYTIFKNIPGKSIVNKLLNFVTCLHYNTFSLLQKLVSFTKINYRII